MTIKSASISVLAAVAPKLLKDYIKFLYVGVVALSMDSVPKTLLDASRAWYPNAKKVDASLGSEIVPKIVEIVKSGEDEDLSPYVRALRSGLRDEVFSDTKVSHEDLDSLKALTAYLSSRNETALRKLLKLSNAVDPDIAKSLVIQPKSQKEFLKPLEKIIYAATKERKRHILTAEEGKVLKASHPAVYKEYLRLRQQYNSVWKDELRNFVLESGKKAVPYQTARKALSSSGIQNPMSETFTGLVDSNGAIFTTKGKQLPGLPGAGFTVKMNPDYDPVTDNTAVFTTIGEDGKVSQYVYTLDYRKKANTEKFTKVADLSGVIDKVRAKWMAYVKKGTDIKDPRTMASVCLELLYMFSARVGSMGNQTGGQATVGISTLQVGNVTRVGNKIKIQYLGKDAVKQTHIIDGSQGEGKFLAKLLLPLLEGRAKDDRLFVFEEKGKPYNMTGNFLNHWFRKLGAPANTTVHKLRHVRGTALFNEILAKNEDKIFHSGKQLSDTAALSLINDVATKVGELLGHVRGVGDTQSATGKTALANYIDPAAQIAFFERLGVRQPKYLAKIKGA